MKKTRSIFFLSRNGINFLFIKEKNNCHRNNNSVKFSLRWLFVTEEDIKGLPSLQVSLYPQLCLVVLIMTIAIFSFSR